jgi:hypothetical protein
MKRLLNVESKYNYVGYSGNTVSTTPTIQNLCIIDTGTGSQARIGNSIKLTYLDLRGNLTINSSATTTYVRLIVYIDTAADEPGTAGEILHDTSAGDIIVSVPDAKHETRFTFLYDQVFSLSTYNPVCSFQLGRPLNMHVKYENDTSSSSDQVKNSLSFLIVSDQATNTPALYLNSVTRFVDN